MEIYIDLQLDGRDIGVGWLVTMYVVVLCDRWGTTDDDDDQSALPFILGEPRRHSGEAFVARTCYWDAAHYAHRVHGFVGGTGSFECLLQCVRGALSALRLLPQLGVFLSVVSCRLRCCNALMERPRSILTLHNQRCGVVLRHFASFRIRMR